MDWSQNEVNLYSDRKNISNINPPLNINNNLTPQNNDIAILQYDNNVEEGQYIYSMIEKNQNLKTELKLCFDRMDI